MEEINETRRLSLFKELLKEVKDIFRELTRLKNEIENLTCDFYNAALQESCDEIQSVLRQYNDNNSRIKSINSEITIKINEWYEFSKSTTALQKLSYPFIFLARKRFLKKFVSKKNEEISAITIDNRFVKEKLTLLEHQLEIAAIQKIKEDNKYILYEKLSGRLEALVSELKYLTPTIPGLCPLTLDNSSIDTLLVKLADMEAA